MRRHQDQVCVFTRGILTDRLIRRAQCPLIVAVIPAACKSVAIRRKYSRALERQRARAELAEALF